MRPGLRSVRRGVHVLAATAVPAVVLGVLAFGYGPVPALGGILDPGGGVWNSASDAKDVGSRTVRLDGMRDAVTVSFDAVGVPAVHAGSDQDLFQAQGYLHARFRLAQLDLERRMARGRLAELNGPGSVESDTFELQSGLLRTAEATWAATPPDSPDRQALTAYGRGVNARLAELRRTGDWPAVFTLTGVYPQDWTPVDSLAIQGLLTQNLNYTTSPLDYALLRQSLGADRTMAWFPVVPANAQRPYDLGPYRHPGVSPLPAEANANATVPRDAGAAPGGPAPNPASGDATPSGAIFPTAASELLSRIQRLPATQIHSFPDSNAWAANGPAVAGGRSMLAGDPHLQLTLPSFWYQMALSAPQNEVTGASLIGLPGIVIGRNSRIAWSMTDVQNQSTVFYTEKASPDHPGQYFWQGAWRDTQPVHYTIPVRGAATVPLTVDLTVHGPVMTRAGQTTSVSWMGNYPSRSIKAILAVNKAQNYRQFHDALADWHAPTLNFTYADDQGDIGIVAAGYFPLVKAGDPWLPLPGTGEYDVAGTIPYVAAPQVHNPPGHLVATANQRPVTADYPYYVGTSMNAYDTGYRADRIYTYLESHPAMTADDFIALQNDVTDYLSTLIVPRLTSALGGAALDTRQRAALDQLTAWDNRMTESSVGATIWWTFWIDYVSEVFQPWWDAATVPVGQDSPALEVNTRRASLNEDLESWTLHDPGNPAFSPPGRPRGDATSAMRAAFARAVSDLRATRGDDPASWQWGRLHSREIPAMTGVPALGYGPKPAEGNQWTVNAAEGAMNSSFGPSWRMVVDWTGPATATALAVYPGGQSENPASPWYQNLIPHWWSGHPRAMPMAGDQPPSPVVWTLLPGG